MGQIKNSVNRFNGLEGLSRQIKQNFTKNMGQMSSIDKVICPLSALKSPQVGMKTIKTSLFSTPAAFCTLGCYSTFKMAKKESSSLLYAQQRYFSSPPASLQSRLQEQIGGPSFQIENSRDILIVSEPMMYFFNMIRLIQ